MAAYFFFFISWTFIIQKYSTKNTHKKEKVVFTQCVNLKGDLHTILVR